MGLLDDAIREHLDLKRRRGVDPTEIERAEQEALGPVRRGPEAPPPAAAGDDAPVAYDHEDEDEWEEEGDLEERAPGAATRPEDEEEDDPLAEDEEDLEYSPPSSQSADRQSERSDRKPARFADEEAFSDEEPFADEPRAAAARPPAEPHADDSGSPPPHPAAGSPPSSPGGRTVEYDALSQGADDDVLEETPEFLQDTPEHDRLWFEQKPPRDFDFND